ncbi:MAG: hypothetical protein ACJ0N6_04160 [Thermodesulfobacteriota bacterium]
MNRLKIFIALFVIISLSGCSYVMEKKDQWFGEDEAPIEEVIVEEVVEEAPSVEEEVVE